jgi:Integrase core domain
MVDPFWALERQSITRAKGEDRGDSRYRCRARARSAPQAFIESWFAKLKERCVWLHEFETLDEAREVTTDHVNRYHHRPQSGLAYKTPSRGRPDLGR